MTDIPATTNVRKWRLSFAKDAKPTGLSAIASPHAHTKIKADGHWVGYITPPSRFGRSRDAWTVGLMADQDDSASGWNWVFFKAQFETESQAREWVKRNWITLCGKYNFEAVCRK